MARDKTQGVDVVPDEGAAGPYHKVRLTYRRYMFGYVRLYAWICKVLCDGKCVKCP